VRSLFVLCGWAEDELQQKASAARLGRATRLTLALLDLVGGEALRGHRSIHRRHYANPRPLAYEVSLAHRAASTMACEGLPDLLVDEAFASGVEGDDAAPFARVERAPLREEASQSSELLAAARSGAYGRIVLFYPDALGLGWEPLEDALVSDPQARVLAVNGRRRVLALSPANRRRLRLRRYLARTRVIEALLALLVIPVAGVLSVRDR
jgi:hypothetical protein